MPEAPAPVFCDLEVQEHNIADINRTTISDNTIRFTIIASDDYYKAFIIIRQEIFHEEGLLRSDYILPVALS